MARKTELLHPANYFWCERGGDGPGWETVMKIRLEKSFSEEFVHTPSNNKSLTNKVRKPRFDSQVVTISFIYSVWIYKVPTHDQFPLASTSRFKRRERERKRKKPDISRGLTGSTPQVCSCVDFSLDSSFSGTSAGLTPGS